MPISAPPPSWASIKNKPTTVAGFGITDMGSQTVANATNASNVPWSGVSSKPTTVAGLGLSDFNLSAITAQAGASFGSVGTVCYARNSSSVAVNATTAGSNLLKQDSGLSFVSMGVSGTWRNLGISEAGSNNNLYLRIA